MGSHSKKLLYALITLASVRHNLRYDLDVLFAVQDVVNQLVEDNFLRKTDNTTMRDVL